MMKKFIVVVGIVALFIGMICVPVGANILTKESSHEGPNYRYYIFGKISSYETLDYYGVEYIHAKAVFMFGLILNASKQFPNLRLPTFFVSEFFDLPTNSANIDIWPVPDSNYYYLRAYGIL